MKNIFIVQPTEAEIARKMEKKLLSLPDASGILFVGVEVQEAPPDFPGPLFRIFIGCRRERDASLMHSIVHRYLRDEVIDERQLVIEARRGHDKSTIFS